LFVSTSNGNKVSSARALVIFAPEPDSNLDNAILVGRKTKWLLKEKEKKTDGEPFSDNEI
jgi:hypothetical protein